GAKSGVKSAGKATVKAAATEVSLTTDEVADTPLSPSELGKWNAAKANQAAFDAHVRNMNFNGTIGALAQYGLAAKAAAGEPLSEAEQAAVDSLIGSEAAPSDEDLANALNTGALAGDPVYSVENGTVSCTANCDTADLAAAQAKADAAADALAAADRQTALDGLLTRSEQRIVDESNKPVPEERADALLDHVAEQLGVSRPADDPVTLTP
ncbi:MAG: hypothetical protein JSR87_03885, partial [Proteobacteria bacterium]|nr:hypothetical protein [Pseudomonadota bacterium]